MAKLTKQAESLVRKYLESLGGDSAEYCPEAVVSDPSLPSIYAPVAAYTVGGFCHALFMTGEYDYDDARLMGIAARYKTLYKPISRLNFLTVSEPGTAVKWLCEPTSGAALVAALYHAGQEHPLDPSHLHSSLYRAVDKLFGIKLARMGEGLARMDQILDKELLPVWTLSREGGELIRPLARALNSLLRTALDEVLPAELKNSDESLMVERFRVWKKNGLWYRFQSLEYVEGMFAKKQAGLSAVYKALFTLNQNPAADVDRVRLRVLTAAEDGQDPESSPFSCSGAGSSSIRGEFLFARRTLISQHGLVVPDLVWAVAECPSCKSRTRFRKEADPYTLYRVSNSMDRIKRMLVGDKVTATFYCSNCRQPLGFEHLVIAAYAHYLADQDRDLHFLNERRPGRRNTYIEVMSDTDVTCKVVTVSDGEVARIAGRPLSAVESWRSLLRETGGEPKWRQFGSGFIGLCLPSLPPFKQTSFIARFNDQLATKRTGFWSLPLQADQSRSTPSPYPGWLGDLASKVSGEEGCSLHAYVDMDRIEELFSRAAGKLGLALRRAFDGTLEVRGGDLTIPVDLKRPVSDAAHRGHFPGVFAAREAGLQARRLSAGERTLNAVREYLGKGYSVQYNPSTGEVMIEGKSGLPAGFSLDQLVSQWTNDQAKTRRLIISKVGG